MLANIFSGGDDLIVILVAVVVLFGGKQLPKLAKNTGEALREFRKAKTEAEAGQASGAVSAAPVAPAVATAPATPVLPVAAPPGPAAQVATAEPGAGTGAGHPDGSVTLSRSELDELLAERAVRAQAEGPKAGS